MKMQHVRIGQLSSSKHNIQLTVATISYQSAQLAMQVAVHAGSVDVCITRSGALDQTTKASWLAC